MNDERELVHIDLRLPPSEVEQLILVGNDLEFLAGLPTDRLPTHTEVRLAASVLRRLFLDGGSGTLRPLFKKARGTSREQLTVLAVDLDLAVERWPEAHIATAWAGGAAFAGPHFMGHIYLRVPMSEKPADMTVEEFVASMPYDELRASERVMNIGEWLAGSSLIAQVDDELVQVSRRTVLGYLANKKGGVHFDPTRNLVAKKPHRRSEEAAFTLLDHGLLRVGHLSGPEYEVVSMAQAVTSTPWANTLIQGAKDMEPAPAPGPEALQFWDGTEWAVFTYGPAD